MICMSIGLKEDVKALAFLSLMMEYIAEEKSSLKLKEQVRW